MIDRYGSLDGPLVILVHGAVVNRATMAPLAKALLPCARVWVPDLPGHGSRRNEPFTLAVAVNDLAKLVTEAGDTPIVIAGDSLGGYLALAVGARCDKRLVGVVAGGCTFPMRGPAASAAALTDVPISIVTALAGQDAVEKLLMRAFIALGGDPDVAAQTATLGLRLASRSESIVALRQFDLAATLSRIVCPVTFVNGATDIPIVWFARHYARIAQRAQAVTIAGASHGVMAFKPSAVAREIESLLSNGAHIPLDRSS